MNLLETALNNLRSAGDRNAGHAMLFVHSKLLALFLRFFSHSIYLKHIMKLMLYVIITEQAFIGLEHVLKLCDTTEINKC